MVANVINHIAAVLVLKTTKARNLQIELIVVVGSSSHPDKMRNVKPTRIEIRSIKDEARKSNAHVFDRSVRCDKTRQLRIFPMTPKMKIINATYRLSCLEMQPNKSMIFVLIVDGMVKD
jgi:hypothetical protein